MIQEYEFNGLHIFVGAFVFIYIYGYIIEFIYKIFPNLGLILAIVQFVILIKLMSIMYNEIKIWAKVN